MTRAVVVGAGIVGSWLTYELAKAGCEVTLVDRGPICELGASRWAFGGVAWSAATSPSTIAFSDRGFRRYFAAEAELGHPIEFRPGEALVLQRTEEEMALSAPLVAEWTARGQAARMLDLAELAPLEPGLRLAGWAGARAASQAHLNVRRCSLSLVERACELGATVREHVTVERLLAGGRVVTSAGDFGGDVVFVVAGAWTRPLLRAAGADLPIFHTTAEFLYSEPRAPLLEHQVSWDAGARIAAESAAAACTALPAWRDGRGSEIVPAAIEGGLAQFADGHVRVGQISRFTPAYRDRPDATAFALLASGARAIFPAFDALPGLALGHRQVSFTPDHLPIVGALPGLAETIVVATSTSPTVMAPAIGEALAAYTARGEWDAALDEWAPERAALAPYVAALRA